MTELVSWDDLAEIENKIEGNNLLLIDGNNLAYRYVGRSNFDSYEDSYIETVKSLGKSYAAIRIIVCFDYGKSYYRLGLLEDYKGTRKKPETDEEIEKYEAFFNCLNNLTEHLPFEYYKHRGIEADDLIAFFIQHLSKKYDHTWMISSDKDLYQLTSEKASIFNLFSRKEITEDSILEDFGLTPKEFAMTRMIEGDKSDNIIGIEGIGPKRSQGLIRDYGTLDKLIEALPLKGKSKYIANLNAGKEILLQNRKLIDLYEYLRESIECGKDGEIVWKGLIDATTKNT